LLSNLRNKTLGLFRGIRDLVFPPLCIICKKEYFREYIPICKNCIDQLTYLPENIRQKKSCADNLSELYITFLFDNNYKKLIHFLKYKEYRSIGHRIGELVAEKIGEKRFNSAKIVAIPIPLHPIKYRERGYNQARLIARGLSQVTGIPNRPNLLKRVKNTKSQTKLSKKERKNNMADAFQASRFDSNSKEIILIDDVYTTGATMDSAAKALKAVGYKNITGIASAAPPS